MAFRSLLAGLAVLLVGCRGAPSSAPVATRLADPIKPAAATKEPVDAQPPKVRWTFEGGTAGWQVAGGAADLAAKDGRLSGRAIDVLPILHVDASGKGIGPDLLHSIEVRLRVSAGTNLAVAFTNDEKLDVKEVLDAARNFPWKTRTPLVPGEEVRTYTLRRSSPLSGARIRHVLLQPTDAKGARFEIESVRLVFRKEHLASIPSGVSWQGLSGIFQETLVTRSPETIRVEATLGDRPWLDLAIGTVEESPVTFRVLAKPQGGEAALVLERTVTTAYRWEPVPIPLTAFASRRVELALSLVSEQPGRLGFWGSPVVRNDGARKGVIVIWADTLRSDHLDVYGYGRPTSPSLRRMAEEGTLFKNCLTQATWTKVSTPTLLTSLYPTSHGVREWIDRVPSSAVTMAEAYRDAGYATFSFPANGFTGQSTNLHQGFDEVQEFDSLPKDAQDKNARVGMERLFAWLERHREVPFFAFLNFLDPHDPYKPYPPYDTLWADPARAEAHEQDARKVSGVIANPLLKMFAMPSREELVRAGVDPAAYVAHDQDWYDGSIRAMDAEIGRLLERLRSMGLDGSTLVVFTSDHGEEFLEHGQTFHGQSAYGELNRAPLILWKPGTVAAKAVVDDVVGSIDLMPTLLEMSGVKAPAAMQGRSLVPLLSRKTGEPAAPWPSRPTITEKLPSRDEHQSSESFAIVADGWKLIHNRVREKDVPEFELYDFAKDPLDRQDLAATHPDVVKKLEGELAAWRRKAEAERVKPDTEAARALGADELERLRALGYIQ